MMDKNIQYWLDLGGKVYPLNIVFDSIEKEWALTTYAGTHGHHDATNDTEIIKEWESNFPRHGWGLVMPEGIFCIDADNKHGKDGIENWKRLVKEHKIPVTKTDKTKNDGYHAFFKSAGRSIQKDLDGKLLGEGIDVLTWDGGGVVIPPTKGYSSQFDIPIVLANEWLLDKVEAKITPDKLDDEFLQTILEKADHSDVPESMYPHGEGEYRIHCPFHDDEHPSCDVSVKGFVCRACGESGSLYKLARKLKVNIDPIETKSRVDMELHDTGNARRLVRTFGERIAWISREKTWACWDGKRWKLTGDEIVEGLGKIAIASLADEASESARTGDTSKANALSRWYISSNATNKILAMVRNARSEEGISQDILDFDDNPHFLNVGNGVIDLETGKLLKHNAELKFTKITPVDYYPEKHCSVWDKFLEEFLSPEIASYAQKFFGYYLLSENTEKKFAYLYGKPNTGKSTFVSAIENALGEFAQPLSTQALTSSRGYYNVEAALYEVARCRVATVSETDPNDKFDASRMKRWTGHDTIQLKTLWKTPKPFLPSAKFIIHGNNRIKIDVDEVGLFKRLVVFPFKNIIPDKNIDANFSQKINLEGVLSWLVEGTLKYLDEGLLDVPDEIKFENESYIAEMDTMKNFINEFVIIRTGAETFTGEIANAYEREYATELKRNEKKKLTNMVIEMRGLSKERDVKASHRGYVLKNVALIDMARESAPEIDEEFFA